MSLCWLSFFSEKPSLFLPPCNAQHTHTQKFADKHNLVVFETSAKEDINVELAFMTLVAMMKERRENGTDQVEQNLTKKLDKKTKCSLQ